MNPPRMVQLPSPVEEVKIVLSDGHVLNVSIVDNNEVELWFDPDGEGQQKIAEAYLEDVR